MVLARIFCMNATTRSSVAAPTRPAWRLGLVAAGLCTLALGLGGCGQKGPLELPSAARPASGAAR
ncbi:lipoprotein [Aquincola sp. MAHUQ-54]|uniref:Lipoprotein n=1 Tax=Aquincola agrisoli TaxID=3119538 RepID=A0AAW9QLG7_9BURK